MRAFLRILVFLIVGPIVGLFTVSLAIGLWTLFTKGSLRDFTFGWDLLAPGILIVSYSVGGIPALLTGIANIFIARWKTGVIGWAATALVGLIMSLAAAAVLFGPEATDGVEDAQLIVVLTLAGTVAGFVCAAVFDGLAGLLVRPRVPA
jgi:hypothetical protein